MIPVVVITYDDVNKRGLQGTPVTIASNGFGTPMIVATNGLGTPVIVVASGGIPVTISGYTP